MSRLSLSRLIRRSSILMAARFAGAALAFAGNVAIARFMGADALGVFAIFMAAASLIAVVLPLGTQATATLFVSEYMAVGREKLVRGYLRFGRNTICRTLAAVLLGAGVLAAAFWDRIPEQTLLTGLFAVAAAPALAIISFSGGVLAGARRQFSAFLPDSLLKPALVLLAVLISTLVWKDGDPLVLLGLVCAGCWLTAAFQACLLWSYRKGLPGTGAESDPRRWRITAWPWTFITLLWDYFIELHLLLAGLLATSAEIAALHICFRLRVLAGFGMRALYAFVIPDLYGAHAAGNEAALRADLKRANRLACAYAVAVCTGVWFVGEFALGIVDESFRAEHLALFVMCLTMVARAVFGPAMAVLAMAGHQLPALWTLAGGLALSLLVAVPLFPVLGLTGIALGYLIANTLIAAVQWWLAFRLTGINCSVFASGAGRALEATPAGGAATLSRR